MHAGARTLHWGKHWVEHPGLLSVHEIVKEVLRRFHVTNEMPEVVGSRGFELNLSCVVLHEGGGPLRTDTCDDVLARLFDLVPP